MSSSWEMELWKLNLEMEYQLYLSANLAFNNLAFDCNESKQCNPSKLNAYSPA